MGWSFITSFLSPSEKITGGEGKKQSAKASGVGFSDQWEML